MTPSGTVTGLFSSRFTPGVVGVATDFFVLGPGRNQTKPSQPASNSLCLVAFDDDWRREPGIRLFRGTHRQINTQSLLDPLGAFRWREIRAHTGSLSLHEESLCTGTPKGLK